MIQTQTILNTADNSGARLVQCIRILGGSSRKNATIGDIIVVSIKSIRLLRKVKPGQVQLGVIVRTKSKTRFNDGSSSYFNENAIVLLGNKKKMLATRLFGPISKKLRRKKFLRLLLISGNLVY